MVLNWIALSLNGDDQWMRLYSVQVCVASYIRGMNRAWVRIRKRRLIENRIHSLDSSDTWIYIFRGGSRVLVKWLSVDLHHFVLVTSCVVTCVRVYSHRIRIIVPYPRVSFNVSAAITIPFNPLSNPTFHSPCPPPWITHGERTNAHESSLLFSSSSLIIIVTTIHPDIIHALLLKLDRNCSFPFIIYSPQCELFTWLMGRATSHVLIEAEGSLTLKEQ